MMTGSKYHEDKTLVRNDQFQPGYIKFKPVDRRRRARKAPVRHPWRQYKLARARAES